MQTTIRQLLDDKGHQVWSVNADTTVYDALRLMAEKSIGALLVMRGGQVVGILSERDYARKVILEGRKSRETLAADIMSTAVLHALPGQSVAEAMALMTEHRIRHLPVMEHGRLLGIISIGDLVKAIIAQQEFVIGQLENYIAGAIA
ncbi:MAG: CBS domain-containing protein [Gammaproteobacteria bacterium]|nr:CBS domain-containing protein [Gammaproteobacteria bacterium]MCP5198931.1 CBS domain-containing protein [Gammaproteobacteria bacterium]